MGGASCLYYRRWLRVGTTALALGVGVLMAASELVGVAWSADHARTDAVVEYGGGPVFTGDTGQPIVIYKRVNPWFGENRDEISLVNDFGPIKAHPGMQGFDVRSTADLAAGIPSTIRIIILPGVGLVNAESQQQIDEVNDPGAQLNLEAFVSGGGCLLANLADNDPSRAYEIPGLSGTADDVLICTGTTITAAGLNHPITLGSDGLPGGGDDLTQDSVDAQKAGSGPPWPNTPSEAGESSSTPGR